MNQDTHGLVADIKTLFPMAKAILRGQYKMPWKTFFLTVLCFIYLVSPIDFVPDFLPLLGIADDGAFLVLVLLRLHGELADFRRSCQEAGEVIEAEVIDPKK